MTRSVRLRTLTIVAVAAIGLVAAGVYAGQRLVSPREAAARARPPAQGEVTVALTTRALRHTLTASGTLQPGGGYAVSANAVAGSDSVVTRVAVGAGSMVRNGALLADVSGRPLIAAVLPFPLYRDLSVGQRGPDVQEVAVFLRDLGYLKKLPAGVNAAMQQALRNMLTDRGYPELVPPSALPDGAVVLARGWLARLDRADRKVTRVDMIVGTVLASPDTVIIALDVTPPAVIALLDTDGARTIQIGQPATVRDAGSGTTHPAVVSAVGERGDSGTPVTVTGVAPDDLSGLSGDLVVTFTAPAAVGISLVAPVTGIYTDQANSSKIILAGERNVSDTREVAGVLGGCAEGYCQVTGVSETLREGQRIVVGRQGPDK